PPPVPGDFNLEVVVNATGTGSYATEPGYQGLAIRSTDGHTLTLLHGDYGVVDNGAGNLILLGDGSESVGGGIGDTIQGGSGPNQSSTGISAINRLPAAPPVTRRSGAPQPTRSAAAAAATRRLPACRARQSSAAAAPTSLSTRPAATNRCSAALPATTRFGPPPATRSMAVPATTRRSAASPA